jgi:hypothetical protein
MRLLLGKKSPPIHFKRLQSEFPFTPLSAGLGWNKEWKTQIVPVWSIQATSADMVSNGAYAYIHICWLLMMNHHGAFARLWMISDKRGISFLFDIRSRRYCQKDTPNFRHVFFKLVKVSRARRPSSLRVLPLTFHLLTYSRISFSLRLL